MRQRTSGRGEGVRSVVKENRSVTIAWGVFQFLFWAFIVLQVVGSFHDWILGIDEDRPIEAQMYGDWSLEKLKNGAVISLIYRDSVPLDDTIDIAQFGFNCARQSQSPGAIGASLFPFKNTYNNQEDKVKVLIEPARDPANSAHLVQTWGNGYKYIFLNERDEVVTLIEYLKKSEAEGQELINVLFSGDFYGRTEPTNSVLMVGVSLSNFSEGYSNLEKACAELRETDH